LLLKRIKPMFMNPQFETDVLKPMNLEPIIDQEVKTLSGGELQRLAIVLALGLQVHEQPNFIKPTNMNMYRLMSIYLTSHPLSSMLSNVLLPRKLLSASYYTQSVLPLSSSTISLWPPI